MHIFTAEVWIIILSIAGLTTAPALAEFFKTPGTDSTKKVLNDAYEARF